MTRIVRACVMGHPVAHSRSPMLHGYWLRTLGIEGAYELADVALHRDAVMDCARVRVM